MRILGIDPGLSGGLALIGYTDDVYHDGVCSTAKMPETERDLWEALQDMGTIGYAYIEKVSAMPKQGVSSTFKFGQNYGMLRGMLVALGVPFEAVAPGVWQRSLGCLSHGNKNITKAKAQELYPKLKITHATADALLIATYGLRRKEAGQ